MDERVCGSRKRRSKAFLLVGAGRDCFGRRACCGKPRDGKRILNSAARTHPESRSESSLLIPNVFTMGGPKGSAQAFDTLTRCEQPEGASHGCWNRLTYLHHPSPLTGLSEQLYSRETLSCRVGSSGPGDIFFPKSLGRRDGLDGQPWFSAGCANGPDSFWINRLKLAGESKRGAFSSADVPVLAVFFSWRPHRGGAANRGFKSVRGKRWEASSATALRTTLASSGSF